jgi:hypothetical protein
MAKKNRLEQLAEDLMSLTPQESEQLAIVIKAKMMPEMEKQAQGLLQPNQQTAQMGSKQAPIMQPGTARNMTAQGLLR